MENKHLSRTRKYDNNNFIIASRAYFQQMHSTEEASKIWMVEVRVDQNTHISHKELKYLLQKSSSPRSKHNSHAPRGEVGRS